MTQLVRHPETPPGAVQAIEAELVRVPGGAAATFRLIGDMSRIIIPPPAASERTRKLWESTCFELFVAGEGGSYREFNFSPSGQWAAYQFNSYRQGMSDAPAKVEIEISLTNKGVQLITNIETEFLNPAHVGLTAVVEETDGIIRYWSTGFAPGKADFHAPEVRSLLFDGVGTE